MSTRRVSWNNFWSWIRILLLIKFCFLGLFISNLHWKWFCHTNHMRFFITILVSKYPFTFWFRSLHVLVLYKSPIVWTGIARLVHVSDLNLTTQILIFPCLTCSVYATKQFGYPPKILCHVFIFLWVLKVFFLIHTMWPPSEVIRLSSTDNDLRCNIHIMSTDPMEICDESLILRCIHHNFPWGLWT